MRKRIFSILSLLALVLCINAQKSISYSLYHGTEPLGTWGTGKAETYNIAVHFTDASLVGKTVKSITIPVVTKADLATDYTAFLSKELKTKNGKAVADITSVEFTPDGAWTKVTFSNPYTIEEGGFYAGYSFTIGKKGEDAARANDYPVQLMAGNNPEGFYLATSRTYRKWQSMVENSNGNSPLSLEIEGNFYENACGVNSVKYVRAKQGEPFSVTATISNYGTTDINNIDCKYTLGDKSYKYNINLPEPLNCNFYGQQTEISFEVPAEAAVSGVYDGTLSIQKVNGKDNQESAITASNTVKITTLLPVKRPVMEEFTGTWCGWCPRGWVAMKILNEKYPDRFIAVSYHNSDPMQIHLGNSTDPYPVDVDGFPGAYIDRDHMTDPYFGDTNSTDMGIELLWKSRCDIEVPANIEVEGTLDANGKLSVTSYTTFVENVKNAPYRVAYMVTADKLTGTESGWTQHSYFPGRTGYGPEMDMFTNGPEYVNLEYDDVIIANSNYFGEIGSLPATANEAEKFSHTYEFYTADMTSNFNPENPENLVQDVRNLNVIALVIDSTTGKIVNAAKARVDATDGINSTKATGKYATVTDIYSIDGKHIDTMQKGINILKMDDGSVRKVVVK